MNKQQYQRYLKLPQNRKKVFLSIAKEQGMDKDSIYWLELGLAVYSPKVRKAMFNAIQR